MGLVDNPLLQVGKLGSLIGIVAAVGNILLWVIFAFFNPYATPENDVIVRTLFVLALPSGIALVSALLSKSWVMLLLFLWLLPSGFYNAMTPGIFKWLGLFTLLFLLSGILLIGLIDDK